MSTCADVGSVIESKTSVVQTSNVGFTSEVSDYLVVHTGPGHHSIGREKEGGVEKGSDPRSAFRDEDRFLFDQINIAPALRATLKSLLRERKESVGAFLRLLNAQKLDTGVIVKKECLMSKKSNQARPWDTMCMLLEFEASDKKTFKRRRNQRRKPLSRSAIRSRSQTDRGKIVT